MRLTTGHMVWLDAGAVELALLDAVRGTTTEGEDVAGTVFVEPEQLLQAPGRIDGEITEVIPRNPADPECNDLPGADLPFLGAQWEDASLSGTVVRLDPVNRSITVRSADGSDVEVNLGAVQ